MAYPMGHGHTGQNATHWDTAVLETFIPGYSIASRLLATYFQLDLSFYLPAIVATTIALAAVKYCTAWLSNLFQNYFISTAEIRVDDEISTYLMFWMARQPFTNRTTRFVAGTKLKGGGHYYYDSDDESDPDGEDEEGDDCGNDEASFDNYWAKMINRDKFKRLRFTPSQGTHYFRYKGRYVAFSREQEDNKNPYAAWTPERLYLSCAGRNPAIIKDLLSEAQRAYVARDGNRTVIYRGQRSSGEYWDWVRCMARPPRPLSTVVLDAAQKKAFVDDIKEYLHPRTRRWYSNRGIPYRRGYLLHGPPGTGKTSLCFAASGLLGLTLYLLNLNSKSLDEDSLMSLFQDLPRRCIVLLEDVDSAGITKKRDEADNSTDTNKPLPPSSATPDTPNPNETKEECEKPPAGLSLSALLNVIDGVAASEGRILVMTTNHAEKLDPALLRPGRVDMSVVFGYAETADIKELFSAIYSTLDGDFGSHKRRPRQVNGSGSITPSPRSSTPSSSTSSSTSTSPVREKHSDQQHQDTVAKQASEFARRVPPGEFTAAEIQGYLLNHKNAPEDAIEGAEQWVRSVQKKREEKRV